MNKMTKQIVVFLLLMVLANSEAFSSEIVKLEIKVKEIKEQSIVCDFSYNIHLEKSDFLDIYTLSLPFEENKNLAFSLLANEPYLYFTYGFRNSGNGIATINSINKTFDFQVDFTNVILPIKKIFNKENGLIVNLNLIPESEPFPFEAKNCKYLKLNNITIQTKSLLDSKPKFELSDKGIGFYDIKLKPSNKSLFFVIPIPPESYLGTFLAFFFIAIFIGIVSAIKLIEGKNQSIFGLIASILVLLFLSYSFYQKVIPSDFNKDIDMISLIGGGFGLAIGILLNSVYNLISINAIEKQQGG